MTFFSSLTFEKRVNLALFQSRSYHIFPFNQQHFERNSKVKGNSSAITEWMRKRNHRFTHSDQHSYKVLWSGLHRTLELRDKTTFCVQYLIKSREITRTLVNESLSESPDAQLHILAKFLQSFVNWGNKINNILIAIFVKGNNSMCTTIHGDIHSCFLTLPHMLFINNFSDGQGQIHVYATL